MFSLLAPPARLLISLAFSLIIPTLNSSLGSSVLPARIVWFNFWLCSAISRRRIVAALDPEEADAKDVVVGTLGTVFVEKLFDGCCPACVGGWLAGVDDVDGCVAATFEAGVEGAEPGFRKEVKELMVDVAPEASFQKEHRRWRSFAPNKSVVIEIHDTANQMEKPCIWQPKQAQ
jgi:hypothetical protein